MATDYRNSNIANLSRGIRNNNPGNLVKTSIKWQGKVVGNDARFETFENMVYGTRAMMLDIINDVNEGTNTPRKLITEYAPPSENFTDAYITKVANALGIAKDGKIILSDTNLRKLTRIISEVENGPTQSKYLTDTDINSALELVKKKGLIKTAAISGGGLLLIGLGIYLITQ
jgi:hypothetical protein